LGPEAVMLPAAPLGISGGQGWVQFGELGAAFGLSALIGLERELRQKAAGLRTHTLVGVAAALIVLVSKYGFSDVLVPAASSPIHPGSPPRSSRASASWARA
jgi:putative Mg2+ transporter-C (MgtC) family protein